MADEIMRLFYTDYRGQPMLALEFAGEVADSIYRRLVEDCQVKIIYEYQQSKLNDSVSYPMSYKPTDASLFTKIFILEGDRQGVSISFLMWELEKRCKLEKDFNLPSYEPNYPKSTKRKIRRKKVKDEKSNNS